MHQSMVMVASRVFDHAHCMLFGVMLSATTATSTSNFANSDSYSDSSSRNDDSNFFPLPSLRHFFYVITVIGVMIAVLFLKLRERAGQNACVNVFQCLRILIAAMCLVTFFESIPFIRLFPDPNLYACFN